MARVEKGIKTAHKYISFTHKKIFFGLVLRSHYGLYFYTHIFYKNYKDIKVVTI